MEMLLLGGIGLPELIAIIVLVLLLFGARRIPDLMKSMGKGVRSFKEGVKGLDADSGKESKEEIPSEGKEHDSEEKA